MNVPVIWLSYHEDTPARGYWDQGIVEALLDGTLWKSVAGHALQHIELKLIHPDQDWGTNEVWGAVVVLPARHHAGDVSKLNRHLSTLQWVVLILTGDEERAFPVDKLDHPRMLVYQQTPPSDGSSKADRYLPNGYTPQARALLAEHAKDAWDKPLAWFFAGQVTHARRQQCADQLEAMFNNDPSSGIAVLTPGFTQGLAHGDYYRRMASAKIAPCPSGPATPDTFRLYEALEAGCLPIADDRTPHDDKPTGYWRQLFNLGDDLPFPIVQEWSELPGLMENMLDRWPSVANRAFAWWQGYKRQLVYQVHDDITRLSGERPEPATLLDKLTVLIPSSPIKAHPDTSMIEETIASVRERLPDSEIIIMLDGVRQEQEDRRVDYEEYQRRLLWKCNDEWSNVLPLRFEEHHHQAAMTHEALKLVRTPAVLFVEHDAPLCEEIPFDALANVVISGEADMIRLHHEALILDAHKHMMLDQEPQQIGGVPLMRTVQWSQRPHIAATDFYRRILEDHFKPGALTMIEDTMHGVVHNAFVSRGKAGWQDYRLWIYTPEGDIKRSYHLDGRGDDPKYEMVLE